MGPFAIDWNLLIWAVITFLCLFALLARFAFKPLSRLLAQREAAIQSSLDQAEKARADARQLLEQNEQRLSEARRETQKIINEGHKIVADMKREAHENAREEAQKLVEHARRDIDKEFQKSLSELKGTVANLSVRVARQVIKSNLDESTHEQLADDFIERLKQTHAKRTP